MALKGKVATEEELAEWRATAKSVTDAPAGGAVATVKKTDEEKEAEKARNLRLKEMSLNELQKEFQFVDASELLETEQFGPILKDKSVLVGTPFLIVEWFFYPGDFGEDFVSMKVVTMDGRKFIVNDGSTGITAQLRATSEKRNVYGGMACRKGLRVSEYTYTNDKGVEVPAATFYIDNSL